MLKNKPMKQFRSEIYKPNVLQYDFTYKNLRIDIFESKNVGLSPLVFILHGGGFVAGDPNRVHDYCMAFQAAGYVAVAVQYSLGHDGSQVGTWEAIAKATQDFRDAITYVINDAAELQIDENKIYAGGVSAGAITVFETIYNSNAFFSTNNVKIKGLFGLSGAVVSIDEVTENIPICMIHGKRDGKVSYETKLWNELTLSYEVEDSGMYGSGAIWNKIRSTNIPYEFQTSARGGHCGKTIANETAINVFVSFIERIKNGTVIGQKIINI